VIRARHIGNYQIAPCSLVSDLAEAVRWRLCASYAASHRKVRGCTLRLTELSNARDPSAIRAVIAQLLKTELPQYERDLVAWQKEMEGPADIPNRPVPDKKDRRRISAEAIMAGEQKYTDIKCLVLAIFADPHDMSGPPMDENNRTCR